MDITDDLGKIILMLSNTIIKKPNHDVVDLEIISSQADKRYKTISAT